MSSFRKSLLAAIAGFCLLAAPAAGQSLSGVEVAEVGSALVADDVCEGDGADEACALNAIQLRGAKLETQAADELEDRGASEVIKAALLALEHGKTTPKPHAAGKSQPTEVPQRTDLTDEEAANLMTQLEASQEEYKHLTDIVASFWQRVNRTKNAIADSEGALLQGLAVEEQLASPSTVSTPPARRRTVGAAPIHAKLMRKITAVQEDYDNLWNDIADLRNANEVNRHYMDNHRRELLLADVAAGDGKPKTKTKTATTTEPPTEAATEAPAPKEPEAEAPAETVTEAPKPAEAETEAPTPTEVAAETTAPAETETKTTAPAKTRAKTSPVPPTAPPADAEDPAAYPFYKDDLLALAKMRKQAESLRGELETVNEEISNVERIARKWLAAA